MSQQLQNAEGATFHKLMPASMDHRESLGWGGGERELEKYNPFRCTVPVGLRGVVYSVPTCGMLHAGGLYIRTYQLEKCNLQASRGKIYWRQKPTEEIGKGRDALDGKVQRLLVPVARFDHAWLYCMCETTRMSIRIILLRVKYLEYSSRARDLC